MRTAPNRPHIAHTSSSHIHHSLTLPEAVPAQRHRYTTSSDLKISYYADDKTPGPPLVLIHSINAAASVFEMKPLFVHYQSKRPVYAPDLPGFGFSARDPRPYSPKLYTNAITAFLQDIVGETADIVALSLGSEFVVRAALERPDLVRSVTVISPTGLSAREFNIPTQTLYSLFTFPLWSEALFRFLTRRRSIRYFLHKNFAGEVLEEVIDYAHITAQQKGARHAPYYFVSGQLFTPDATESLYKKLDVPGLIVYDRDPNVSFDNLPAVLEANPNWQAARIAPTCGLPHWEKAEETIAAIEAFWAQIETETTGG